MNPIKTTPKDFFLWAGAMISLYWSVISFISLFFTYIDYAFPDALNGYVQPYSSAMTSQIASLIILFPLFLVLMWLIRRDIAQVPEKRELWVRKWALVLTVFVAGAAVVVDFITLVNDFLGGDLTQPFGLKVLVVLLVAGAGFLHFLADLRGHWDINPGKAKLVAVAASIAVICTIGAGFLLMGSPWQVRLYRFDDQKVSDLQNMQWQVVNYWQQQQKLPASLSDLNDPLSNYIVPNDPQSNAAYGYATTSTLSFKLCATFNADTQPNSQNNATAPAMPVPASSSGGVMLPAPSSDSWYHASGYQCFARTIDPARYPPVKK